jgi:hypothetical protein
VELLAVETVCDIRTFSVAPTGSVTVRAGMVLVAGLGAFDAVWVRAAGAGAELVWGAGCGGLVSVAGVLAPGAPISFSAVAGVSVCWQACPTSNAIPKLNNASFAFMFHLRGIHSRSLLRT